MNGRNPIVAGSIPRSLVAGFTAFLFALSQAGAARSVTLAWDANTEPDLAGYRLYYGTTSGTYAQSVDVGSLTSATVSSLEDTTTYFFVVTAYNTSALESFVSNEVLSASTPNQPPVVSLSSPTTGTSFTETANVALAASASDSDGTIGKVEFFEGLNKIGEATSSPFVATWNNVPKGNYQIAAVAHDDKGATTRSADVSIHVRRLSVNATRRLANGTFELTVSGAEGHTMNIEVSDDLQTWRPLTSVINITGTVVVVDPDAAIADRRFYRVSSD